jgi:hypothetical protein
MTSTYALVGATIALTVVSDTCPLEPDQRAAI